MLLYAFVLCLVLASLSNTPTNWKIVEPRSVDEELTAKHLNMQDGRGWNILDCSSMLRFQFLQLQNSKGL